MRVALSDKPVAVWLAVAQNVGPVSVTGPSKMFSPTTIAEVDEVAGRGQLDPEHVVTPGILVGCVCCPDAARGSA